MIRHSPNQTGRVSAVVDSQNAPRQTGGVATSALSDQRLTLAPCLWPNGYIAFVVLADGNGSNCLDDGFAGGWLGQVGGEAGLRKVW